MNLRNVLRAYGLLRSLSDDESALLNILRTLNDSDREQLVVSMSDKPQKKPGKKGGGGGKSGSKSARASSLQKQIQGTTMAKSLDGGVSKMRCAMENCGDYADSNVHHLTTHPVYHEFQPPQQAEAATGSGG